MFSIDKNFILISEYCDRCLILRRPEDGISNFQFSIKGKLISITEKILASPGMYSLPDMEFLYKTNFNFPATSSVIGNLSLDDLVEISHDSWPLRISLYRKGVKCGELSGNDLFKQYKELSCFLYTNKDIVINVHEFDNDNLRITTMERGPVFLGIEFPRYYSETVDISIPTAKIVNITQHGKHWEILFFMLIAILITLVGLLVRFLVKHRRRVVGVGKG